MRERLMRDHVGLGWRGELAVALLEHFDEIEVLEVIAEDWTRLPRREQMALRQLAVDCPLMLHGVSLGLASSIPVDLRRLDRMARLVDTVRPTAWSEHLAFVRAGGIEVGHLAAPPRTCATIDGALENIRRASRAVGSLPALENIATLIDPPASTCDEASWTREILGQSAAPMLLDLHNLYANALNFGTDPETLLLAMPLEQVRIVHLSGGRWLYPPGAAPRLLDDHLHDVPDPVFELLGLLAAQVAQPLQVIIERDGNYPDFAVLRLQMQRARGALAVGRKVRTAVACAA
jgi:hypothetical protein